MTNRFFKKIKSRKGLTMLEVVAAVSILAIVVLAAVTAVNLSHSTVLSQGSSANAAAQAQSLADELITELHTKAPDDLMTFGSASDYGGVAACILDETFFPKQNSTIRQYCIIPVKDPNNVNDVIGYRIRTAVFYTDSNGRKCVQMQAFSAKDGG